MLKISIKIVKKKQEIKKRSRKLSLLSFLATALL
jgi:hypothetical protein